MQFITVLIVGWLTDWLASHVAGLDPVTARKVSQALADAFSEHVVGTVITLVATGWYWFRRPGDLPATVVDDYRALLKVGIDPAAPAASAPPVKEVDPRG